MNKITRTKLCLAFASIIVFATMFTSSCSKSNDPSINNSTTGLEFIDYTVNGNPYSHTFPSDSIEFLVANNGPTLYDLISSYNPTTNGRSGLHYLHENILPGDNKPLLYFGSSFLNSPLSIQNPPILINFTEFGPVGQYIAGDFSGVFKGSPPNNTIYNITCSFRVKRTN